tara:strand:+ start:456 stop:1466 length:1011 start_codon:yes stop_codon:yes gene_type:complete
MYESVSLIILLINLPVLFFYNFITKKINLYDHNDGKRKFHITPIPLIGGFLLIYNILIFIIFDYNIDFKENIHEYFFNTRESVAFFSGIIFCFLLGVYDDKFNLSAYKKLIINFFIISFVILLDEGLVINQLSFTFLENPIDLRNLSYFFSVLCFLLFINALNMFDGINLQTGSYCILILSIFIFKGLYILLSFIIILTLIIFLFYNFKNKAFLGDGGTQLLAFVISYILIKSHNQEAAIRPEEIFIFLAFPGLDMLRLFILRLSNGKNPFTPDTNHIHHLISRKYNKFKAYLLLLFVIAIHIILYYQIDNKVIILLMTLFSYILMMSIFKSRINK